MARIRRPKAADKLPARLFALSAREKEQLTHQGLPVANRPSYFSEVFQSWDILSTARSKSSSGYMSQIGMSTGGNVPIAEVFYKESLPLPHLKKLTAKLQKRGNVLS